MLKSGSRQFAVHVQLALAGGGVADAHGRGAAIAREMGQLALRQVAPAVDGVENLHVRPRGVAAHALQELHEAVGLVVKIELQQGVQHERRVAQPGEAVIPVARAARRLGQGGGRRRDDRARRLVRAEFERQGAALHLQSVRAAVAQLGRPGIPPARGLLELALRLVVLDGQDVVLIEAQHQPPHVARAEPHARRGATLGQLPRQLAAG